MADELKELIEAIQLLEQWGGVGVRHNFCYGRAVQRARADKAVSEAATKLYLALIGKKP
jgi:hypothetical protein